MSPKTYYQILQVDREASLEIIEAAHRRLARIYHPDLNSSSNAVGMMKSINEAYSVLKDPIARYSYDKKLLDESGQPTASTSSDGGRSDPKYDSRQTQTRHSNPTQEPYSPAFPVRCQKCGRSDPTLRLAVFPYVISVLVVTLRRGWSGLYCGSCRAAEMNSARLLTLFLGWWGIPWGPIYTLGALFSTSESRVPAEVQAGYLRSLAGYYLRMGERVYAEEALRSSLQYEADPVTQQVYRDVFGEFPSAKGRSASDQPAAYSGRRPGNARTWLILAAVAAVIAFLAQFASQGNRTPTQPPTLIARAPFILYEESEASSDKLGEIPVGVVMTAIGKSETCAWLKVTSPVGNGWIHPKSVFKESQCSRIPIVEGDDKAIAQSTATVAVRTPTMSPTNTPGPRPTLTRTPKIKPKVPAGKVLSSTLQIYAGPGLSYDKIHVLEEDDSLTILGQQANCRWLKVENDQAEGWVRTSGSRVDYTTPCADLPIGVYRPESSMIKKSADRTAEGVLSVDNGATSDTIVVVVDRNGKTLVSAYVRKSEEFELTGIPDGTHWVYTSSGTNWDGKEFTSRRSNAKFEESFAFETDNTAGRYTVWEVTLYPVKGGTARTDDVGDTFFPSVE